MQARFIISLAWIESEQVSYNKIKKELKEAFLLALHSKESNFLKRLILHNLAVVNFIEIQDWNDRLVEEQAASKDKFLQEMTSPAALETLDKIENEK